jgi:ABC-type bacteriocin/lantibiotic exporter with double-glycine peptidase domain
MIFKNLPAIITLVAALVACVVTFLYRYELTKALILILAATVVFFIIGMLVRTLLNRFLNPQKQEGADEKALDTEGEDTEEDE